mmetsp:Transcript_9647/g.14185  ORF Transcript_9647/g.14185 Transcript_9647/m.14185 type:complete len:368 (-) Transcript_9647:141-1244(-)|eukprot:CAMPEP_0194049728 /NCGR_PEP_ID=MMETSP0009_2-20130614/30859_1 /TAXON_ID=210454 /ORGANISM="Grammatophora oceanica, Strain CCMP 410" /LENGTH=367 /DNA_ID=CAMNT_0038695945 /DNA_START=83 /DNA_END=1186 /DNA_ORIENTATION=-
MPHVELPQAEFKVVMLGHSNTGKTSLVLRFAEGYFRASARCPTVGAFFITKRLQVQGITCKVQIWDTAGQEQFRILGKMYYQNAAAAILCYDVSSRHSFEVCKEWLEEVHRNITAGTIVLCICATKSDLQAHSVVPTKEAELLASTMGALYVQTSAKENTNVTLLYEKVAERVLQFQQTSKQYNGGLRGHHGGPTIPVTAGAAIDESSGRIVRPGHRASHTVSSTASPLMTPASAHPSNISPTARMRKAMMTPSSGSSSSYAPHYGLSPNPAASPSMSPHSIMTELSEEKKDPDNDVVFAANTPASPAPKTRRDKRTKSSKAAVDDSAASTAAAAQAASCNPAYMCGGLGEAATCSSHARDGGCRIS